MLAIVIPYYKLIFFDATLQSLAYQTDKRFKVYIGDDASSENPTDLLNKYKGKFDFVYHRFESNLGGGSLIRQWERCIALSSNEEWIMILGDDDILGNNLVESFYNQYKEFNELCNVVRFASVVLNEQDYTISEIYEHPRLEKGIDFFIRKLKWETRSSLSEYFFKREVYLKYHFKEYPSGFYSDDRAWIDFSEDKPIYTINESVVTIRISDSSLSGTADKDILKQAEYLYLKYFYENKLSSLLKKNRLFVLKKIEFYYYFSHTVNFKSWFYLYTKYWSNFDIRELYRFHKRILLKILKN
ncbi:glycosyltransferase family 2 protein [Flavobacterium rhamnosiphilum]|uniref:Glycosyltransferase family 2 protein n=1 Tax=Flavobacterium rhamnosiphilum TaxID=2541724 RepID=A0A4V2Z9U9_9FLAO|nr:glycosyltransferase family A protein [Flavobacterium rhamnosiphilum]TDE46043.1 glycosyltransferase family 2 protein [Flavobacterium rhamnosiphilum]